VLNIVIPLALEDTLIPVKPVTVKLPVSPFTEFTPKTFPVEPLKVKTPEFVNIGNVCDPDFIKPEPANISTIPVTPPVLPLKEVTISPLSPVTITFPVDPFTVQTPVFIIVETPAVVDTPIPVLPAVMDTIPVLDITAVIPEKVTLIPVPPLIPSAVIPFTAEITSLVLSNHVLNVSVPFSGLIGID